MDLSWLEPLLSIGSNAYKLSSGNKSSSGLYDVLKGAEDRNFADTMAYNDAARAYNEQAAAAANARSRASAAASAANQRNSLAASNAAWKRREKDLSKMMEVYAPFKDTALNMLPKMSKVYEGGLNNFNMLNAYLNRPENMAKLGDNVSQWNSGAPIPEWARRK
jgi:hypothetical protein